MSTRLITTIVTRKIFQKPLTAGDLTQCDASRAPDLRILNLIQDVPADVSSLSCESGRCQISSISCKETGRLRHFIVTPRKFQRRCELTAHCCITVSCL